VTKPAIISAAKQIAGAMPVDIANLAPTTA
jgi:hypothetical protein